MLGLKLIHVSKGTTGIMLTYACQCRFSTDLGDKTKWFHKTLCQIPVKGEITIFIWKAFTYELHINVLGRCYWANFLHSSLPFFSQSRTCLSHSNQRLTCSNNMGPVQQGVLSTYPPDICRNCAAPSWEIWQETDPELSRQISVQGHCHWLYYWQLSWLVKRVTKWIWPRWSIQETPKRACPHGRH